MQSAGRLFGQLGFKAVTIDHVMTESGFTRGIFYRYFKSKSDLYQQSIMYSAIQASIMLIGTVILANAVDKEKLKDSLIEATKLWID